MMPGTTSVMPSDALFGGFGPMTQKTVRMPSNWVVPTVNVTRIFSAPPHRFGGIGEPKTTPQPYDWYSSSCVAFQVPLRLPPPANVCVKRPSASTDFGLTVNVPSPVTATRSPFGASATLGLSISRKKVCGSLSAYAVADTSRVAVRVTAVTNAMYLRIAPSATDRRPARGCRPHHLLGTARRSIDFPRRILVPGGERSTSTDGKHAVR